jgi:hypothetical protein
LNGRADNALARLITIAGAGSTSGSYQFWRGRGEAQHVLSFMLVKEIVRAKAALWLHFGKNVAS